MSTAVARQRRIMAFSIGVLAVMAVGLLLVRVGPSAVAESGPVVANWQLNEGSSASTMNDSSGNEIDGVIGDDVDPGGGQVGDEPPGGGQIGRWSQGGLVIA